MTRTTTDHDALAHAWLALCETLRDVPATIERLGTSNEPRARAEGYRHLARLLRMALERGFEGADADHPRLLFAQGPSRKIGGDCPDAVYRDCTLAGGAAYRVFGTRGNAASVVFTINRDPAAAAAADEPVLIDHITSEELCFDADGAFELWLGGEEREGNWRPLPEDAGGLMIRQFFGASEPSVPATLSIERLDGEDDARALSIEDVERAIVSARLFMQHIPQVWSAELRHLLETPNHLAPLAPERQARLQATPGGVPLWGSFRLDPNEALVVEFTPPDSVYWSLMCGGPWFESLDARTQVCHLNMDQAVVDGDGLVRIVVAHQDPGAANWLQTGGHAAGFLLLRYLGDDPAPAARCRVVRHEELRAMLPASTRLATPADRAADLAARRWSSDRRFEGL